MKHSIKRVQSQAGLSFAEREDVRPKVKQKLLFLLVLLLTAATGAWAAVPDKVYYRVYDYSDGKLTYTDNEIAGTGVTEVTSSTTEWENGTYVVPATTEISSRITVTGTVNLIILDGAELTAQKGITVSNSNTLNIYMGNSSNSIQSTGKLTATAYREEPDPETFEGGAGIGGWVTSKNSNWANDGCGTVTIHGGTVLVNQSENNTYAAGIGNAGYVDATGGNITIYYSHVTAYGRDYASALGAGWANSNGTVAIYGGEVNAIVLSYPQRNGIGASLTVGKDVQVYALSGSKSPDENLSDDTNVAPEGGGQVTTFNNSMFTRYTGPAPTPLTYSITLADGTEDDKEWTISPTEAAEGTTVTVTYGGERKVKSVKAVKKAAKSAEGHALSASAVGEIVGSDGKAYAVADKDNLPSGVTAVAMVAYKSGSNGLAIQLNGSPVEKEWDDAKTYVEGLTAVSGGTWRLPSKADWKNMFVSCAVSGDASASDEMNPIAGFKAKIAATGITWKSEDYYWSSTESDMGAWSVLVNLGDSNAAAFFDQHSTSSERNVLGCLAF